MLINVKFFKLFSIRDNVVYGVGKLSSMCFFPYISVLLTNKLRLSPNIIIGFLKYVLYISWIRKNSIKSIYPIKPDKVFWRFGYSKIHGTFTTPTVSIKNGTLYIDIIIGMVWFRYRR